MSKKIYFVGEGSVGAGKFTTDKFNQLFDPDTQEELCTDVYQITDCAEFEKYEQKEMFLELVLGTVLCVLNSQGEVEMEEIIVSAIDSETNAFLWGVKFTDINKDNFKYATLDWKAKGVLVYADDGRIRHMEGTVISRKQLVEELNALAKEHKFNVECDNSYRIDFKFSNVNIETDYDDECDGEYVGGEIVFYKLNTEMDLALNLDAIKTVIKESEGRYQLLLNIRESIVFIDVTE